MKIREGFTRSREFSSAPRESCNRIREGVTRIREFWSALASLRQFPGSFASSLVNFAACSESREAHRPLESATLWGWKRLLLPRWGMSECRFTEGYAMTHTVWSRISAVLVLFLLLTPAVFAAPRQAKRELPELRAISWLTEALSGFFPASVKSSGTMDLDGKPQIANPPASSSSDSSGTMDPDGRK